MALTTNETAAPTRAHEGHRPAHPHVGTGYGFRFLPCTVRVRAVLEGVAVADSRSAMVLEETRLPPVYYFPREDVRMDLARRTEHRTHCPFKGNASYWTVCVGKRCVDNAMWSYEDPLPEARHIAGYVAFYAEQMDHWYLDDEPLDPAAVQHAPVASGVEAVNPLLGWLMRDAPELATAEALTAGLAEQMLASGMSLWRLAIVIRTLHPQLSSVAYRWWLKDEAVERFPVSYEVLDTPQFQRSPLKPIFEGAGGIRRRLDIDAPLLDFGVLEDLRAEGATDYVAMPLRFSDRSLSAITMSSTRRGGFSTSHLGQVYEILAVLARFYEGHEMRARAEILLDTYLGRHAGARVLAGRIKRGDGESIDAVIWFCDLRGSTTLAERSSREAFLEALNEYFDCMAGAVLDHGGQVLRFIGDAALAIFPVPATGAASAAQVCRTALTAAMEAEARIATVNANRRKGGLPALGYGIGLHIGEVTYGNIGARNRLEFTVIGEAANRAARIESMCKELGRTVLASADFARHIPGGLVPVGHFALRGLDTNEEIFTLSDPGDRD